MGVADGFPQAAGAESIQSWPSSSLELEELELEELEDGDDEELDELLEELLDELELELEELEDGYDEEEEDEDELLSTMAAALIWARLPWTARASAFLEAMAKPAVTRSEAHTAISIFFILVC